MPAVCHRNRNEDLELESTRDELGVLKNDPNTKMEENGSNSNESNAKEKENLSNGELHISIMEKEIKVKEDTKESTDGKEVNGKENLEESNEIRGNGK